MFQHQLRHYIASGQNNLDFPNSIHLKKKKKFSVCLHNGQHACR